jgi:hypothetical protein
MCQTIKLANIKKDIVFTRIEPFLRTKKEMTSIDETGTSPMKKNKFVNA